MSAMGRKQTLGNLLLRLRTFNSNGRTKVPLTHKSASGTKPLWARLAPVARLSEPAEHA